MRKITYLQTPVFKDIVARVRIYKLKHKNMKVILLQDIRNIGKKKEIRDVSDGYARNFLFPNAMAKPATGTNMKEQEKEKAHLEKEDEAAKKHLVEISRLLNDRYIEFPLKTGEHGEVFGSITKETILKALRDTGWLGKERVEIKLDRPLKKLGEHVVGVDFKKGINAKLKVVLRPQQ